MKANFNSIQYLQENFSRFLVIQNGNFVKVAAEMNWDMDAIFIMKAPIPVKEEIVFFFSPKEKQ